MKWHTMNVAWSSEIVNVVLRINEDFFRHPQKRADSSAMFSCFFHKSSFARFDNRIGVESIGQEAKRAVTGFPDMLVKAQDLDMWLITMVIASPLSSVVGPLPNDLSAL